MASFYDFWDWIVGIGARREFPDEACASFTHISRIRVDNRRRPDYR